MNRRRTLLSVSMINNIEFDKFYIYYTSSDGNIVTPYNTNVFGANIGSNKYINGQGGIISFYGPVTSIGYEAFRVCNNLTSITIPDSVTSIGVSAFQDCDSLASVTIPDSVTTIGDKAFYYCKSLTSVNIHDSITTIGIGAFQYCSSLTSITIPDSVTSIGDEAFQGCSSLTSITIPNSVTSIGEGAFRYCRSLKSITIGNSVTSIGVYAFYDCSSLTSVYCKATTPPSLRGTYVFDNNGSGRKIYVPTESVDAYRSADGWSEYASDIVGYSF